MRKIREVLRLKLGGGLSARQVAGAVRVSPATVGDLLHQLDVLGLDGARLVVGEGAVQLEEHGDDAAGQVVEDRRYQLAGHAVSRIHHDAQGLHGRDVDECEHVLDVLRQQRDSGLPGQILGCR